MNLVASSETSLDVSNHDVFVCHTCNGLKDNDVSIKIGDDLWCEGCAELKVMLSTGVALDEWLALSQEQRDLMLEEFESSTNTFSHYLTLVVGDQVLWNDPDAALSTGMYKIADIQTDSKTISSLDDVVFLKSDAGSEVEAPVSELSSVKGPNGLSLLVW